MAKHRITIEVDGSALFDAVAAVGGSEAPGLIGIRLLGAMMTGERDWKDDVGLAVYGIEITQVEKINQQP